jgi:hypothetical protein
LDALIPKAKNTTEFTIYDLFEDEGKEILGTIKPSPSTSKLDLLVNLAGGVRMVKLVPKQ